MSKATKFNRPALKRQAFLVALAFAIAICLIWFGFWVAGAAARPKRIPQPLQLLLTWGLVVGFILWNSLRKPRSELKSWIQFRLLCRRRRWVELFGFAIAIMLFGVGLGAACSVYHWFHLPPAEAAFFTIAYAAAGGALGFFGGFSLHFPALHGTAGAR